jgi:hypothetical protein
MNEVNGQNLAHKAGVRRDVGHSFGSWNGACGNAVLACTRLWRMRR